MRVATSTLTRKGQTTIPKAIREHFHLQPGDRIEFVIEEDGRVTLVPATLDVADLKGALPRPKTPVTLEDMERAVSEGALRR